MIYQTLNFFTDNNVKENKKGLQHETDKRIFLSKENRLPKYKFCNVAKVSSFTTNIPLITYYKVCSIQRGRIG